MLVSKDMLEMGQLLLCLDEIKKDTHTSHIRSLRQSEDILACCCNY